MAAATSWAVGTVEGMACATLGGVIDDWFCKKEKMGPFR